MQCLTLITNLNMKAYKAGLRLVRKWLEIESGIVGKSTGPALAWTVIFLLPPCSQSYNH
jgi:hypothetical protein